MSVYIYIRTYMYMFKKQISKNIPGLWYGGSEQQQRAPSSQRLQHRYTKIQRHRSHYSNVAPQLCHHKWILFWSLLLSLLLMKGSEFFSSLPLHVAVDLYLLLAFRTLFPFPFLQCEGQGWESVFLQSWCQLLCAAVLWLTSTSLTFPLVFLGLNCPKYLLESGLWTHISW